MPRLVRDKDGREWVASIAGMAGAGAAAPGADVSSLYDRAHLVFESVDGREKRPIFAEDIPTRLDDAGDADLQEWLVAASPLTE